MALLLKTLPTPVLCVVQAWKKVSKDVAINSFDVWGIANDNVELHAKSTF